MIRPLALALSLSVLPAAAIAQDNDKVKRLEERLKELDREKERVQQEMEREKEKLRRDKKKTHPIDRVLDALEKIRRALERAEKPRVDGLDEVIEWLRHMLRFFFMPRPRGGC